ncbi:MAG: site-specific integrase [Bacteroidota bacterium]
MRKKSPNTPKFYLKNRNSTKETKLRIEWFAGYEGKPISISSSIDVIPKNWSHKEQKVTSKDKFAYQKNSKLADISKKMMDALYDVETQYRGNKSAITNEKIKNRFIELFSGASSLPQQKSFWEAYDEFIARSKQRMKSGSANVLISVRHRLEDYEKAKNVFISFDMINIEFRENFVAFLYHERTPKLNPNTVSKTLKILKSFLNDCFQHKIFPMFDISFMKSPTVPTYHIALSQDDLDKLWRLDVDDYEKYDKVRDLFLLQCYTAMRVSDLMKLTKENIKQVTTKQKGKKVKQIFIEFVQEKTGSKVSVPATNCVADILAKYPDYNLPKISGQKYNQYLKELCQFAGIIEEVKNNSFEGNQRITTVVPKWVLVSSHCARRTFATITLQQGISAETVRQFTGHSTEKQLYDYAQYTPNVYNKELIEKWQ